MDSSDEVEVARTVGIGELTLFSRVAYGGGACVGLVHQAAMAVATGAAKTVVVYRALNGRSGQRMGQGVSGNIITSDLVHWSWYMPYGMLTPASWVAICGLSGLGPGDIDAAILYDAFTWEVLAELEAFGFCPKGEARDFVRAGGLAIDGRLPTNTHGGLLSEAYIHGVNGIAEGVRLVRGTSTSQPKRADHVLVTSGVGVPTGALILGRA
jgi:acetyl-CoA acetyltransferase